MHLGAEVAKLGKKTVGKKRRRSTSVGTLALFLLKPLSENTKRYSPKLKKLHDDFLKSILFYSPHVCQMIPTTDSCVVYVAFENLETDFSPICIPRETRTIIKVTLNQIN